MQFYHSVRAVASASGDGAIDWDAVADAAQHATEPGSIALSDHERTGYAEDVRDARDSLRERSGVDFDVPSTIEIQSRHHWVEANIDTFARILDPLDADMGRFAAGARKLNTASMATSLSFLASRVLGQYDPLLLADGDGDHGLYFVHPNVQSVATELGVEHERFRRWIAFHEVTHAAEFAMAPWLTDYIEDRIEGSIDALQKGSLDRDAFRELNLAMTAVEGYAELLMDEAFDQEYEHLRRKLDGRRNRGGPITRLLRRALGIGLKRRQYERGREFFEGVLTAEDMNTATQVWDDPENLPTDDELDSPSRWVQRVT